MEKNILLELEYRGTNYYGFQLQDKVGAAEPTVQEAIERALKKLFARSIRIVYAGRTDRGVHARAQVANFKVDTKIALKNIKRALNALLPRDIRVNKVKKVPPDFHSRFSASSKIYQYVILNRADPSVFSADFTWHLDCPLDLGLMRKTAKRFIGRHDFSLFARGAKEYKDCHRRIKDISLKRRGSLIYIDIEGDGFLRCMVRNIVSFLVQVGNNKIPLTKVALILKKKIPYSNKPAPACGLYLVKVNYKK